MSDTSLQPQILNLGSSISSGEIDSLFFAENNEQSKDPFQVDANLITTGRTCVIGSSGSGKSYTVGVICERGSARQRYHLQS